MANTLGDFIKVSSFGESHGPSVGVVISELPAGLELNLERIQERLDQRRPGQSSLTTSRDEKDKLVVLSGLEGNTLLASPLCLIVNNSDHNPSEYNETKNRYRPSHADYTYHKKYAVTAASGGGRSSARETVARVIAGAVCEQILEQILKPIEVISFVDSIYTEEFKVEDPLSLSEKEINNRPTRTATDSYNDRASELILKAKDNNDSIGGSIFTIIKNPPLGLGSPVFHKLEARLASAMLSIPATKGFEIGSGFSSRLKTGSEHNDEFLLEGESVRTKTNYSGGVQGGISNGMPIYFRTAFKPTSTIAMKQSTLTKDLEPTSLEAKGRHDPCVLPRATAITSAMTYIILLDELLKLRAQNPALYKTLKDG